MSKADRTESDAPSQPSAEIMLRALWTCLTPFVRVANRLGLCSYKWVNVCIGARRPDLFNPLWHHRHFGTPIHSLPSDVILCGIGYRASASEGTVTFFNDVWRERITFERDTFDGAQLWTLTLSGGTASATHVKEAYEWVCAVFGGSFVNNATTEQS